MHVHQAICTLSTYYCVEVPFKPSPLHSLFRWEIEVSLREDLEVDIQDLRNLANEYCECRNTVACEINVLEDEICHLKNSHREEIEALRQEYANSTLNVDIDHSPGVDLASIINDIRTQYETMISSTNYEVECLIQNKLDAAQASAHQSACNLEAIKTDANNLRYEYQALEVEAESLRSANCILEENLHETEARLNLEISNLAQIISVLEADYADVRANIERQIREYESLLNVKMQLEMEISTYQQLIDCEDSRLANVSCGRVCYGDAVRCTALPVPCGANPCSLNVCPSEPKCGGPCGVCGPCLPCA
uniref:keratin, type I cuticular Ha6-like n=1 Tax=Myxine glutinosa TaxID=7769 RepID=UPI00358E3DBD